MAVGLAALGGGWSTAPAPLAADGWCDSADRRQTLVVTVLRVRGWALPTGEWVDLYADGDCWTDDPVPGAELVAEGWLLPGLVDAHTHPGAEEPGDPLDEQLLREDLTAHARAGVTLLRAPGLAGSPPGWFGRGEALPRAVHAGPWLAQAGQFLAGWGERPTLADLPGVAAAQARESGWAKIVVDWGLDDPSVPVAVLRAVVEAVHGVGGRVAVHSQHDHGGAAAVEAAVDSLEHGMCLDPSLLDQMAAQGTALTPTLHVLQTGLERSRSRPSSRRRDWYLTGAGAHAQLVASAAEAGVTLLAGTDSRPHGLVAQEIQALVGAGVDPHTALGAASWAARTYLGLGGLEPGAPADAVIYRDDPRLDVQQLHDPEGVVLRGQRPT